MASNMVTKVCFIHHLPNCRVCYPHRKGCQCEQCIVLAVDAAPPALRPRNSAERKAEPIHSGVLMYFPDALAAIARVSKKGNDKHNPGEPLHWARGKSTDQLDCVTRHTLTPEAIDPDSGEVELAHGAWRSLAELQLIEERRLRAAGILPYSGVTE